MERVNEHECEFRFGDHGPKYLLRGPRLEWGIIRFQSGQALGAHKHEEVEETFYFEEGTPLMVVNGEEYRVVAGDVFRLEPGESHNTGARGEPQYHQRHRWRHPHHIHQMSVSPWRQA